MKINLMLKMIFLLVVSSCKNSEMQIQTINMRDKIVNHRLLTFDAKKCTLKNTYLGTTQLSLEQHGLICITPETFNKFYLELSKEECK